MFPFPDGKAMYVLARLRQRPILRYRSISPKSATHEKARDIVPGGVLCVTTQSADAVAAMSSHPPRPYCLRASFLGHCQVDVPAKSEQSKNQILVESVSKMPPI